MNDTTREAFEQHIRDSIVSEVGAVLALKRDEDGDYLTLWVADRWAGYQAATERATQVERDRCSALAEKMTKPSRVVRGRMTPDCKIAAAIRQGGDTT